MTDYSGKNVGAGNGGTGEREKTVDRAKSIKERHAARLKTYPNVVGVGVGQELVGGRRTDRVCIRVYVRKKLPKSDLPPGGVLPDNIDGLPVDVIEDEFVIHQAPPVTLEDHSRPHNLLVGGISIGNLLVGGSGTLGVSVFDNRTGQEMLLSNWHVLCFSDTCQVGEPIIQPGAGDLGTANDVVARLLRAQLTPDVDAAIAEPLGQRPLLKEVLELGVVEASGRATLGMTVRKSGRTTGLTTGTVADVSADVDVRGYPNGTESFRDQIVVEGEVEVSLPGDSGSVWVDEAKRVVGLNFAGGTKRAIANHIDAVLAALDINLGLGMTVLDWHTRAGVAFT
jgi:hypothetical protein